MNPILRTVCLILVLLSMVAGLTLLEKSLLARHRSCEKTCQARGFMAGARSKTGEPSCLCITIETVPYPVKAEEE